TRHRRNRRAETVRRRPRRRPRLLSTLPVPSSDASPTAATPDQPTHVSPSRTTSGAYGPLQVVEQTGNTTMGRRKNRFFVSSRRSFRQLSDRHISGTPLVSLGFIPTFGLRQ